MFTDFSNYIFEEIKDFDVKTSKWHIRMPGDYESTLEVSQTTDIHVSECFRPICFKKKQNAMHELKTQQSF